MPRVSGLRTNADGCGHRDHRAQDPRRRHRRRLRAAGGRGAGPHGCGPSAWPAQRQAYARGITVVAAPRGAWAMCVVSRCRRWLAARLLGSALVTAGRMRRHHDRALPALPGGAGGRSDIGHRIGRARRAPARAPAAGTGLGLLRAGPDQRGARRNQAVARWPTRASAMPTTCAAWSTCGLTISGMAEDSFRRAHGAEPARARTSLHNYGWLLCQQYALRRRDAAVSAQALVRAELHGAGPRR